MAFIQGEGRSQGTLFPVTLDELIPEDHVCRVIDAFVGRLDVAGLGFERAEAAETGRPGYDPRDLLKLYLYGYLQQIRSSRRLEAECQRNIELMWLLGRLCPDHKSIAEFRRLHRDAVVETGAELIRFARSVGLVRGEWIAIDGSKFRAVSSAHRVHERRALQRYLESMETADAEDEPVIDHSAVASALEKLRQHPEPEGRSCESGGRTSGTECGRRCWLLQWRTGLGMRGARDLSPCTSAPWSEHSRRWHPVRSHPVSLPGADRHHALPGGSSSASRWPQRSIDCLRRAAAGLRGVPVEVAVHRELAPPGQSQFA